MLSCSTGGRHPTAGVRQPHPSASRHNNATPARIRPQPPVTGPAAGGSCPTSACPGSGARWGDCRPLSRPDPSRRSCWRLSSTETEAIRPGPSRPLSRYAGTTPSTTQGARTPGSEKVSENAMRCPLRGHSRSVESNRFKKISARSVPDRSDGFSSSNREDPLPSLMISLGFEIRGGHARACYAETRSRPTAVDPQIWVLHPKKFPHK